MIGFNVNDDLVPFTDLILQGIKTIETRNSNTLKSIIGEPVGLIKTSKKNKALLVGIVKLSDPIIYKTEKQFKQDFEKHRIKDCNLYGFKNGIKYGYPVKVLKVFKTPKQVQSFGIVLRKI